VLQVKKLPLGNRRFRIIKPLTLAKRPTNNRSTLCVSNSPCIGLKRNSDPTCAQILRWRRLLAMLRKFASGDARTSIIVALAGPFRSVLEMIVVLISVVCRVAHGVLPNQSSTEQLSGLTVLS
jgi:hypothetical protein